MPEPPPLDKWVEKSSGDLQQTIDLRMRTAMIERLDVPAGEADTALARKLAQYICASMRAGRPGGEALGDVYPSPNTSQQIGITTAARSYCLDAA